MSYPKSIDPIKWEEYLKRPLTNPEKFILQNFKHERNMNEQLQKLHNNPLLNNVL